MDRELVVGALVDEPARCTPCRTCGFACARTDDGECWDCSTERDRHMELGGEA